MFQAGQIDSRTGEMNTDSFRYWTERGVGISENGEIAVVASSLKDADLCICLYDDGHFTTNTEDAACDSGEFSYSDILGLDQDEDCMCC